MGMAHGVMMMLAASAAALRSAAPLRKPLTLRTASAADAIRDALSFAQRASPATADDRLAHSMRARDLTEDELRAVLVGRRRLVLRPLAQNTLSGSQGTEPGTGNQLILKLLETA